MRVGRTTDWGHRLIQDTAMLMAGVAGLGVMPLLLVVFGSLPPSYVTYPVVAGVIIGCYLLLSRKLYDYRLGRRWQPGPQPRPQRNDPPKNSTTEQERPPP
jgi:hypothetical protein